VSSTTPARRILIVDDDVRITDVLRMMLEGFGYTAKAASTADDALTKAAAFHPDLVLLDAGMPGADVLDALKETAPGIPVLVVTGDPVRAQPMLLRGAVGCLAKPFTIEALRNAVKKILT
jgi:two-component system OmpR family response regulator